MSGIFLIMGHTFQKLTKPQNDWFAGFITSISHGFYFVETYVKFVVAESKLENYLSENPPSEKNIPDAQQKLAEPERLLNDVLHCNPVVSIIIRKNINICFW